MQNAGPAQYWRLAEPGGAVAASSVIANEGTDNGTYTNVTLAQPGPLSGSTATATTFNGTSSSVHLPGKLVASSSYQSISMWFKATAANGILFSYNTDPITAGGSTASFTPTLYVGSSGKLYGELFVASTYSTPIVTSASVVDSAWHHVVLAGAATTQSMYLDGVLVGTKSGTISTTAGNANEYIGTGFSGRLWPDEPFNGNNTASPMYFKGSIADVATFERALSAPQVATLYATGHVASAPLTLVTRPSGKVTATIAYNQASNLVSQVTDANGGVWKLNPPTVSGSSQVYVSSVLSAGPADYWRLNDSGVTDLVNQVNGNTATYSGVTNGVTGGPFADSTVGSFNGTSDYVQLPAADVPTTNPVSVGMWFKMPLNNTAGGVLYSYQAVDMPAGDGPGNWTPALYVGTDGKLRGEIWDGSATAPITTTGKVNDGVWHHVVLAASASTQTLYLDGATVGTINLALVVTDATHAYVGVGKWAGSTGATWPGHSSAVFGYWPGQITEVAYFNSTLSAAQVSAEYATRVNANGAPAKTVTITDPGNATITHVYDVATGRQLSDTNGLANTTRYGYDTSGFLHTVTDPNGNVTTTTQDVRGNTMSVSTCQNFSAGLCSTIYYTYYPDDTSATLTPDPRNDMVLTMRDGRSSGPTDNAYLTTYAYDTHGNRTSVLEPQARTTTTAYTDGTTVAAQDTGFAPAGLPSSVTTPGGAVQSVVYFHNGDVARLTDPAAAVTAFGYDGLGRAASTTKTTDTFPGGVTMSFTYNGLGQVITETDPPVTDRVTSVSHRKLTTTVYDDDGLCTSQTTSDLTGGDAARTSSTTYNSLGQAATSTDATGNVTTLSYDAYGNMIKKD